MWHNQACRAFYHIIVPFKGWLNGGVKDPSHLLYITLFLVGLWNAVMTIKQGLRFMFSLFVFFVPSRHQIINVASASKVWRSVQIGVYSLCDWMLYVSDTWWFKPLVKGAIQPAYVLASKHGFCKFHFNRGMSFEWFPVSWKCIQDRLEIIYTGRCSWDILSFLEHNTRGLKRIHWDPVSLSNMGNFIDSLTNDLSHPMCVTHM